MFSQSVLIIICILCGILAFLLSKLVYFGFVKLMLILTKKKIVTNSGNNLEEVQLKGLPPIILFILECVNAQGASIKDILDLANITEGEFNVYLLGIKPIPDTFFKVLEDIWDIPLSFWQNAQKQSLSTQDRMFKKMSKLIKKSTQFLPKGNQDNENK